MEELSDGEIVWVKVSNSWWPGEVMGDERLTEEFLSSLRKKPLAVVKFFQEDTYEYVKNPSFIFKYNCPRKAEFLRKGLEQCRAKKKHMETFPEDVMHAERMTGGDPNIVNSTDFLQPKKERYSGLFQESRSPVATLKGNQKGKPTNSSINTPSTSIPMRKSAHEVRILPQSSGRSGKTSLNISEDGGTPKSSLLESGSSLSTPSAQLYHCYNCNYTANRQNLIVLHMKHCRATSGVSVAAPSLPRATTLPPKSTAFINKLWQSLSDATTEEDEPVGSAVELSVAESEHASMQTRERKADSIIPQQTGTRGRSGRTPKQTSTVSHRRKKRDQFVKQERDEHFLDDGEAATLSETEGQTKMDNVGQSQMQPGKEFSNDHEPEAMGKKSKTDAKLKNELLADWSEDEQEEAECVKRGVEQKTLEHAMKVEEKICPPKGVVYKESNEGEALQQEPIIKSKERKKEKADRSEVPLAQNWVAKPDAENDKAIGDDEEEKHIVPHDSKPESTVQESCPLTVAASVATATVCVAVPITNVLPVISPCTTIKYRNIPKKQKREYIEVTNDDASSVTSREGSTASSSSTIGSNDSLGGGTPTTSATNAMSERPISAKQLILNRATRGSSDNETAAAKVDETGVTTVSHMESPESKKSCSGEASCFDFDDEEEIKQKGIIQSGNRKSIGGGRKTSAHVELVTVASTPTDKQDQDTDRDAQLSQEIDSLLYETYVPKLPDDLNEVVVAGGSLPSDKIDCNRTLPPKERGKRIFKTRNKTNATSSMLLSSDGGMNESQEKPAAQPRAEGNETVTDNKSAPELPSGSQLEEDIVSEALSKDRQKPIVREKEDGSVGRGRRFENSDFATIKSKRGKYSKKEQEDENQIPSITSSEALTAAASEDVKDMEEVDAKKGKESNELGTTVTTTDTGLAGSATSSLIVKNSSAKGRRGKPKKITAPTNEKLSTEPQLTAEEEKPNHREQKAERAFLENKRSHKVVVDIVETVSVAKKKRKSSEPHLPDSSGTMETSQQPSPLEKRRGRKRKETSPSREVAESGDSDRHDGEEFGRLQKKITEEEGHTGPSISIAPPPISTAVATASTVVGMVQSTNAGVTLKSINPRKRHLQSMLQSTEAISSQMQSEAKIISSVVDTSTDGIQGPVAVAPVAILVEHGTTSIPEKRKREIGAESSAASTTEEPEPQQVLPPALSEDDKFDIDSMPIVMGDNNGMLVNEAVIAEQPTTLADASTLLPTTITVVKSINGSDGGATSSSPIVVGGLPSKTTKEKRATTIATMKGGSSTQEQIVITSKGTVLTTSAASISVSSKMPAKSSVMVTSAITIGTGARSACLVSATTTTGLVRQRTDPSEQSESSSSAKGQMAQQIAPQPGRLVEGATLSAITKGPTAVPSSSSFSSSTGLSSSPKKAITKKLLHEEPTISNSTSSSSKLTVEAANEGTRCAVDGASSSVSSSSSAGTSIGGSGTEVGKKNTRVLKVTPQKLKEFSRLGYIEDRGQGKVLTPSGMRKFKQELQHQQQQQQQEETQTKKKIKTTLMIKPIATSVGAAASSSTTRKAAAEVVTSGNVVVAAAADSSVQESISASDQPALESPVEGGSAVIIAKSDNIPAVAIVEASTSPSGAAAAVFIDSSSASSAGEVILGTPEQVIEASSSNGGGGGSGSGGSGNAGGVQESSQLMAVTAENFGGPPNLFYLCSVRDETLVPVNNVLLYLDASNQLVALPEQQQQQHSAQHNPGQAGATAEDIINQAEVIIPTGSNVAEVAAGTAVGVATEAGSIVDTSAGEGAQQSFLLNTQDGQQIILDQQSLMALATGGDTPHILTADGQQILLQETAQEWLAAFTASQQGGQQQSAGGALSTLVTPEGTQIIVAHEHAGLIELQEHPVLLPTDIIQVNPNTTIETNAVLTKPPIMSTVEVPTKNGIEASAVAGRAERKGSSASSASRAPGGEGEASPPALLRGTTNLDESLAAVIGHVPSNPNVPTSLELPITVTNPAIAKTTTTSSRLNPPLFPVTTIATTVPSPSDVLSSATTVVLIAADQATIAAAGTIDRVSSPSNPLPSPSPSSQLSAAMEQSANDESTKRGSHILTSSEKTRKLSTRPGSASDVDDADDIQIPNTPESQQNSEQQIEYAFSDNEVTDDAESNDHPARELGPCDVAPECSDLDDGNSNCSEIIPLQSNVVFMDGGMLLNNVEDDGIDEEMDNENESDEDDAAVRHRASATNSQRRASGNISAGQQNRNENGSATDQSEANVAPRHRSNNNDSGIDTNMHALAYEGQAGYAGARVAQRTTVER